MKLSFAATVRAWFSCVLLITLSTRVVGNAAEPYRISDTNHLGEMLAPLKAGESNLISYGLYCVVSNWGVSNASVSRDLILILRNTGAKSINMEDITVENFNLQDSHGRNIKLYLWNSPRTMGYRDVTVIHLVADHYADAVQPCTLRFKSGPKSFVPLDLSITGIDVRGTASSKRGLP